MPYDLLQDERLTLRANGELFCDGEPLCIRDRAFFCYYLIQKERFGDAAPIVLGLAGPVREGKLIFRDEIFWLWSAGEYLNRVTERAGLERVAAAAERVIRDAETKWNEPDENWICPAKAACYLSNISAVFGALRSFDNVMRSERTQRLMIRISDFLYENFLSGGRLASLPGGKEILGEITAAAVPFALVDAGNQILVESVNLAEKDLFSGGVRFSSQASSVGGRKSDELNFLAAWYYAERGDLARAEKMISLADGRRGTPFARILAGIAYEDILAKQSEGLEGGGIRLYHDAVGTGNPYRPGVAERYPLHPAEGDRVRIRAVALPFDAEVSPCIEYAVNGAEKTRLPLEPRTLESGEHFWQAEIGPFGFADSVEYRFKSETGPSLAGGKTYRFSVRGWRTLSDVVSAETSPSGATVYFSAPEEKETPFLRFEWAESGASVRFGKALTPPLPNKPAPESVFRIGLEQTGISLDLKCAAVSFGLSGGGALESDSAGGTAFAQILTDGGPNVYRVRFRFKIREDEKFFGMGERYSAAEYRGLEIDNYVYNQYGDQKLRTYLPVPFSVSSRRYGVYLAAEGYSVFRFGSGRSDLLEIESETDPASQSLTIHIFTGTPKEIIMSYTALTGRPVLPPGWAFGPWMSSHNWDSQAEVYRQLALAKRHEVPATVMVLEAWSDEATFYIFNDAQYRVGEGAGALCYEDFTFPRWGRWPDPKQMTADLHENGIRVLLWQAPVQKYMDGVAHAQRDEDEKTMLEQGYMVRKRSGKPYRIPAFEWFKNSLVPDFANSEARRWWFSKRRYLVKEIGIDGFKTDGGECLYGEDTVLGDGRSGNAARNSFPNVYIGAYHDFLRTEKLGGGVTFSRAGYTGAQKIPMHWAGDERSTFAAFRASLRAGLSCGFSGVPFWGWDLGGFKGAIPSAELYIRSAQMAAFCPVMQYHAETKGQYNQDRTPWNIAERTGEPRVLSLFKKYADLRMNLLPYLLRQAEKSGKTGIPMMRMMFLEYPDDPRTAAIWDQYFFGDDLLVAPVVREGAVSRDVYLPDGEWSDFFDGGQWSGNRVVTVGAPIEKIPVFVKKGSVIPLNLPDPLCLCGPVGNRTDGYRNLCFLVVPKDAMRYRFQDEFGNDLTIECETTDHGVVLSVHIAKLSAPSAALILRASEKMTGAASEVVTAQGNLVFRFDGSRPEHRFYLRMRES